MADEIVLKWGDGTTAKVTVKRATNLDGLTRLTLYQKLRPLVVEDMSHHLWMWLIMCSRTEKVEGKDGVLPALDMPIRQARACLDVYFALDDLPDSSGNNSADRWWAATAALNDDYIPAQPDDDFLLIRSRLPLTDSAKSPETPPSS